MLVGSLTGWKEVRRAQTQLFRVSPHRFFALLHGIEKSGCLASVLGSSGQQASGFWLSITQFRGLQSYRATRHTRTERYSEVGRSHPTGSCRKVCEKAHDWLFIALLAVTLHYWAGRRGETCAEISQFSVFVLQCRSSSGSLAHRDARNGT